MSIIIYPDIPRLLWIINHGSDSWGPHIPWIPLQSPSRFQSAHWVSAFGHERHGGFQQKSRRPGDGFKPIQTEGTWDQLVLEQYYTFGVDIHYKSGKKYLLGKIRMFAGHIPIFPGCLRTTILGTSATHTWGSKPFSGFQAVHLRKHACPSPYQRDYIAGIRKSNFKGQ